MSWEMKILYCCERREIFGEAKEVLGWVWGRRDRIDELLWNRGLRRGGEVLGIREAEKAGLPGACTDLWGSIAGHQEHLTGNWRQLTSLSCEPFSLSSPSGKCVAHASHCVGGFWWKSLESQSQMQIDLTAGQGPTEQSSNWTELQQLPEFRKEKPLGPLELFSGNHGLYTQCGVEGSP